MKIVFVLTGPGKQPVGGYKVVYEYANRLASRGHQVSVVHPAILRVDAPLTAKLKKWPRYIRRGLDNSYLPSQWFDLDRRVDVTWVPSLAEKFIPDGDVVVATAWQTAEWVARYPASKGRKYYLIQHLETWFGPEDRVMATWRAPLHKLVICRWLEGIARNLGEASTYIPNGLDFRSFGLDILPEDRVHHQVMMLYHDADWKGSTDGLKALAIVREAVPELRSALFGVPRGNNLPDWIEYHRTPPQRELRELYNQAAIFIAPSWAEGWGLPPSEAMMCGAAVVGTDIGGHQEFMADGNTALLTPIRSPDEMARCVIRLIRDPEQRIVIAKNGYENIQQFTWDRATDTLEAALSRDTP